MHLSRSRGPGKNDIQIEEADLVNAAKHIQGGQNTAECGRLARISHGFPEMPSQSSEAD
jgi:hypothetical protein